MIQAGDILLKFNDEWLHFSKPVKIITAENVDEVRTALQAVEQSIFADNLYGAGFLSYEAAPAFDRALKVMPTRDCPLLWFGLYPRPLAVSLPMPENTPAPLKWQPSLAEGNYQTAIGTIKDHLAAGRTYQVNYTMRLGADFGIDPWDFFLYLAQRQNKYAAYVDTGRYVICSASPELFFDLDGDIISGRPMKGTIKRGRTTAEDAAQEKWLRADIKNRAENVMIVDMIRNDIGRIAEAGSVHVPELFTIEKYPTLFQMTSTVRGKTSASLTEIFSALYPCASITGAPKISTMNIIAELETTPRKIYTGSIGFISPERKAQFNVAIRTALIDRQTGQAEYGVGGGVVWDSSSEDEYNEALLKARVLNERQNDFSLIETALWTPEEGYFLREKHIRRMSDSAEYFGFTFSEKGLKDLLDNMALTFTSPQRVRILLDRSGKHTIEAKEVLQAEKHSFKVCLAEKPVSASNAFLFHKTTRREDYDEARQACRHCDDVLLFNEKDELTEFTIGNLVVERDGELFTPPIDCGLLAGTFREYLLESRQVTERAISIEELANCKRIFLVNSVRKWLAVELVSRMK